MLMKVNSKVFQGKSQFELSFCFLKGNFKLYTGEPCEGMYNICHPTPPHKSKNIQNNKKTRYSERWSGLTSTPKKLMM